MSCYLIQYKDGAKVMMPISSIQHYLTLRSEEKHVAMVASARSGHSDDKRRLLQFNYSCIPDESGLLRGCKAPSNSGGMDVDFDDVDERKIRRLTKGLVKRCDELGLLLVERGVSKG